MFSRHTRGTWSSGYRPSLIPFFFLLRPRLCRLRAENEHDSWADGNLRSPCCSTLASLQIRLRCLASRFSWRVVATSENFFRSTKWRATGDRVRGWSENESCARLLLAGRREARIKCRDGAKSLQVRGRPWARCKSSVDWTPQSSWSSLDCFVTLKFDKSAWKFWQWNWIWFEFCSLKGFCDSPADKPLVAQLLTRISLKYFRCSITSWGWLMWCDWCDWTNWLDQLTASEVSRVRTSQWWISDETFVVHALSPLSAYFRKVSLTFVLIAHICSLVDAVTSKVLVKSEKWKNFFLEFSIKEPPELCRNNQSQTSQTKSK